MRKEVLFAILAGAVVGAVIAFGVWRANNALKTKEVQPSPAISPEPTPPEFEFGITLAKPENFDVITQSPVTLSGITKASVWVVISAEDEDYIIKSDESGSFEQEVELTGGLNQIIITVFDEDGKSIQEKLTVVFSTEFAKDTKEDITAEEEAKEEADTVREKVQQKLEQARANPKAYLGTITDIAENTIQIKSIKGEIQQVSVDETTTFVKVGKTKQTVKYDDVAIGDYIISMGFKGENEVLKAKRILLTQPAEPVRRKAIYGEVVEIDRKTVTLKVSDEGQWTAKFGKKWVGPELNELSEGFKVIVAGEAENTTVSVRTLFIIPEATEPPSPTPSPSPSPSPSPTPTPAT